MLYIKFIPIMLYIKFIPRMFYNIISLVDHITFEIYILCKYYIPIFYYFACNKNVKSKDVLCAYRILKKYLLPDLLHL